MTEGREGEEHALELALRVDDLDVRRVRAVEAQRFLVEGFGQPPLFVFQPVFAAVVVAREVKHQQEEGKAGVELHLSAGGADGRALAPSHALLLAIGRLLELEAGEQRLRRQIFVVEVHMRSQVIGVADLKDGLQVNDAPHAHLNVLVVPLEHRREKVGHLGAHLVLHLVLERGERVGLYQPAKKLDALGVDKRVRVLARGIALHELDEGDKALLQLVDVVGVHLCLGAQQEVEHLRNEVDVGHLLRLVAQVVLHLLEMALARLLQQQHHLDH
mmetsp:Transcript_27133/g.67244  ORF Transcript_27133/g.67244 Transcript_27133/m.67244 type:complete len:273 (-) Transcript_27133:231-1049(-)